MLAVVITLSVVVALLTFLVIGLLRSHGEILRRLHEIGAGVYDDASPASVPVGIGQASAPGAAMLRPGVAPPRDATGVGKAQDLAGVSPSGSALGVGMGGSDLTLLAFLSSGCGTCGHFWQAFRDEPEDVLPGYDTRLVVVTRGPESESPSAVQRLAPRQFTTVMSTAAYSDYGVEVSPYFVLVDGRAGRVAGEGAATTWPHVRDLMRQACADTAVAAGGRRARVGRHESAAEREARADAELLAAGIGPDHPSLRPDSIHAEAVADEVEP